MKILVLIAVLGLTACSKKENEISPAIASAPAPTAEQKKADSAAAPCGSGLGEAVSCSVHPEAETSSKK